MKQNFWKNGVVVSSIENTPEEDIVENIARIDAELERLDKKLSKLEFTLISAGQISNLTEYQKKYFNIKTPLVKERNQLKKELENGIL